MVLAVLICELGLKKEISAGDEACGICGCQSLSDVGFKVVAALVGCIDGAKAGTDGEFGKGRCAVFFPGSAVKEAGNGWGLGTGHGLFLHTAFCCLIR